MARFYPIIDRKETPRWAGELASELAAAGCGMIQVRAKGANSAEFFAFALEVVKAAAGRCHVIVNDRLDIALTSGADGVHLGQLDLPVAQARRLAPHDFIIGATARDVKTACKAAEQGADYIGAGAVFATGSKSDTRLIGLDGLARIASAVDIPVYGIAGITLENCRLVVEAGAYGCAGITAVSRAGRVKDAAAAYKNIEKALRQAGGVKARDKVAKWQSGKGKTKA
ncbi:MAG: thiamine phosphate synthase [Gemmatimonadota bacterium]|nr:thiamine phosphate synthase [Gemmatimonadota bacterium]